MIHTGDCLDIMRKMRTASVDLVITDPPYGINTKSDGGGKLSPWGDLCNSAFWYAAWIGECRRVLKDSGALWSFLNWRSLVTFQKAACDIGWPIESLLVWDKEWIGPGGVRGLRPSYELVALFACEKFSIVDRGIPDIFRAKWSSIKPTGHPAEKPVALINHLLEISSAKTGQVVLDPFMGSGTTLVAASQKNIDCIGIELEAFWCESAERRIAAAKEASAMPLLEGGTHV